MLKSFVTVKARVRFQVTSCEICGGEIKVAFGEEFLRLLRFCAASLWAGIAQSVQWLTTGWIVRASNPGRGEIFRIRPDRPRGPPCLLYNGYRVIPGGKAAGAWRWPHTSSNAEVKVRVELYLYSPSVPLWQVIRWILLSPFTCQCDSTHSPHSCFNRLQSTLYNLSNLQCRQIITLPSNSLSVPLFKLPDLLHWVPNKTVQVIWADNHSPNKISCLLLNPRTVH